MLALARLGARSERALGARGLAVAATVKALAAEQSALRAAVAAIPDPTSAKVKALIDSDPSFASTLEKVKAENLSWTWAMLDSKPTGKAVTVAVVGAGSKVGAAALYHIAAGEMLGPETPVVLQLAGADAAVRKDLEACGFPLLKSVTAAGSPAAALKGAAFALVLEGDMKAAGGAVGPGTVVGVMGNTNAMAFAKAADKSAVVTAVTSAPALAASIDLAKAAGVSPADVENVISWGSGIADISHATVDGKWALKVSSEALPAAAASEAVAADAAVTHMAALAQGTDGKWVSMGVPAVGDYGMGEGFFFSVPVTCTPVCAARMSAACPP